MISSTTLAAAKRVAERAARAIMQSVTIDPQTWAPPRPKRAEGTTDDRAGRPKANAHVAASAAARSASIESAA